MAPSYDLPVETLEQILAFADDTDLVYKIAEVHNYKLCSLALKEYFKRYNVLQPKGIDVSGRFVSTTLYALHLAPWIKDVPNLTIRMDGFLPNIRNQVKALTKFIHRLGKLGTLNIHIAITNTINFVIPCWPTQAEVESGNIWREYFGALLSVALSKGINGLFIFGPDSKLMPWHINMCYEPPMPASGKRQNWMVKKAIRLCSYILPSTRSNLKNLTKSTLRLRHSRKIDTWGEARLKVIRLSSMLLTPLFFWDTIGLLSAHAHTIHTLNFHQVSLGRFHHEHWEVLLTQIQFPVLRHFTFTGPPIIGDYTSLIPLNNLFSFLDRHPKISQLKLLNMSWGDGPESEEGIPYLPNLTTLFAHTYLVACILQRPDNSAHLQHLALCSLSPRSYPSKANSCLPECDLVLAAIASHVSHAVKIDFRLERTRDVCHWMSGAKNPRSLEILPTLTYVYDIKIILGRIDVWTTFLAILPNWLGLFPSLEHISLNITMGISDEVALRAAIRNSCSRLKSCAINGVL